MPEERKLDVIYDKESGDYVIIWRAPVFISNGKTLKEAMIELESIFKEETKKISKIC